MQFIFKICIIEYIVLYILNDLLLFNSTIGLQCTNYCGSHRTAQRAPNSSSYIAHTHSHITSKHVALKLRYVRSLYTRTSLTSCTCRLILD